MGTLLNRRRYMGGGSPLPTGYIQDGLVFHLDGSECTSNSWVDKVNNVSLDITPSNKTATVTDGGVVFNGDYCFYNTAYIPPAQSTSTIEITMLMGRGGGSQRMVVYTSDSSAICYSYNNNTNGVWIKATTTPTRGGAGNNVLFTQSISEALNIINGTKNTTSGGNVNRGVGYCFCIGAMITAANLAFSRSALGTLYQVRIYNRQLTEAEMLHNQQIDMEKYGINT